MLRRDKKMILIIGNGFDLAHGFKTSYNDFANFIIREKIVKPILNQSFEKSILRDNWRDVLDSIQEQQLFIKMRIYQRVDKEEDMYNLIQSNCDKIRLISRNTFLGKLYADKYDNWFDIENAYFKEVIEIEDKRKKQTVKDDIETLNKDLKEIKDFLHEYLKTIEIKSNDQVQAFFQDKFIKNDIEDLYIINFNYTSTIEKYFETYLGQPYKKNNFNVRINYIHGDLNSDNIIFGYGNDNHKDYKKIKDSEEDKYLKFFKTFEYSKNRQYLEIYENALEVFSEYEVAVVGHSLGQTDKTLLKEILDNPKCKRINLYKRNDLKENEDALIESFNTMLYALSRIIDNEKDLRKKVSNYKESIFFPSDK